MMEMGIVFSGGHTFKSDKNGNYVVTGLDGQLIKLGRNHLTRIYELIILRQQTLMRYLRLRVTSEYMRQSKYC